MKIQCTFIFIIVLLASSCNLNEKENVQLKSDVQALKSELATVQKALASEKLKTEIGYSMLAISPLQGFFLEVENWDVIDVSNKACHDACTEALEKAKKECEKNADPCDLQKCINAAIKVATSCHKNC